MNSLNHDRNHYKSILLTIALTVLARHAAACGPDFPNNMLDRGDAAVLEAPRADFLRELEILHLPRPKFQARNAQDFAAEAAEAEAADLRAALKEKKLPAEKQKLVLQSFEAERAKLTDFRDRLRKWNPGGEEEVVDGVWVQHDPKPRPTLDNLDASALADVPGEFVDYLQGSAAWFNQQTNEARGCWEALVRRPAEERHYRSTWAAYMLGRSWLSDDPETAIGYFQQVRMLKSHGFSDRIGLAAASLGEEARALLRQRKFDEAIKLYVAQLAAGGGTAAESLLFACRAVLSAPEGDLPALAADSATRRVMTAFIISRGGYVDFSEQSVDTNCLRWLEAVEAADVKDVESAEQLALAAYQAGQWQTAQRWIQRAPQTPTAQWLQAKLLLRGGKIAQAALLLQRVAELFPTNAPDAAERKSGGLENALYMTRTYTETSIRSQIEAETGVLHLARREYTEALDALLRGDCDMDAAYVAERVLTTQELKAYVDQNWPPDTGGEYIRDLLARRLARAGDFDAARPYYPSAQLDSYDTMVTNLDLANNAELSGAQRKEAFMAAAGIFHTNGVELLSTEVWPDWHGSGRDWGLLDPTTSRQATNSSIVTASDDELERAREGVDPSLRFHYQYQAAGLAWEAAKLMEDNTDEKARTLCEAGSWIKARDAQAADYFYKALVRRCRKTAIGALADRMRWFPTLDDNGNPIPWHPAAPIETNGPATEAAGIWYALNRGNTLQDVADAAQQGHNLETTVALLERANPEINVNRLKAGLKIFVPAPAPPPPETPPQ